MEVKVMLELRMIVSDNAPLERLEDIVMEVLRAQRDKPAFEILRGLRVVEVIREEPWDHGSWDGREVWE